MSTIVSTFPAGKQETSPCDEKRQLPRAPHVNIIVSKQASWVKAANQSFTSGNKAVVVHPGTDTQDNHVSIMKEGKVVATLFWWGAEKD
ncbi:MAG: hypothetical protein Q4G59_04695, partial [Planctomycetia bacterium]|nr:hypothetical protein [Planctomycetia bacterium]